MIGMATKKLYRSPRGKVFGVATGLAEWRDLNPDMVRLIVLIVVISTGAFPGALIYLAAALIIPMNPGPQAFEGEYYTAKDDHRSDEDLQSEYDRLKKKVEKMENDMFNKERDWDDRFHEGK